MRSTALTNFGPQVTETRTSTSDGGLISGAVASSGSRYFDEAGIAFA